MISKNLKRNDFVTWPWQASALTASVLLAPVGAGKPVEISSFDDPQVRMDYSAWSPDGTLVLFDRVKAQGRDVCVLEEFE